MAGTIFGLPFDEELFIGMWQEAPDPIQTALFESGVMVKDAAIERQLSGGGNLFTVPFYNVLDGDAQNYDGQTDITPEEIGGGSQTGIAFGRARAFFAKSFAAELSGADPMGHIAQTIAKYWNKQTQNQMLRILGAIFGISGADDFTKAWKKNHITDLSAASPYTLSETDLNEAAVKALGDQKTLFKTAVMHSSVAKNLEAKQLLEYWKYTDKNGISRPMNLASVNGFTVVIDDSVPVDETGSAPKYTTYLLGEGVLRQAAGRLDTPAEVTRDPMKNGGQDTLITRVRQAIHPNGFSFKKPATGWTESPTDAQLADSANWSLDFNPKTIPVAKIISNG